MFPNPALRENTSKTYCYFKQLNHIVDKTDVTECSVYTYALHPSPNPSSLILISHQEELSIHLKN